MFESVRINPGTPLILKLGQCLLVSLFRGQCGLHPPIYHCLGPPCVSRLTFGLISFSDRICVITHLWGLAGVSAGSCPFQSSFFQVLLWELDHLSFYWPPNETSTPVLVFPCRAFRGLGGGIPRLSYTLREEDQAYPSLCTSSAILCLHRSLGAELSRPATLVSRSSQPGCSQELPTAFLDQKHS